MEKPANREHFEDEITLRDVILSLRSYALYLLGKWKTIALVIALIAVAFTIQYYLTPPRYKATCTFMLNDQDAGAGLGISSILGQFGLPGRGEFKLEKIAELSKTRSMTKAVMFQEVELDGKEDLLANHYIRVKEEHGEWVTTTFPFQDPGPLKGFEFTSDSTDGFSREENSALILLNKRFREDLSTNIDDITGILSFDLVLPHEVLGYELLNRLFDQVSDYYTQKSVEKQQATYSALAAKCDSLENTLNQKEFDLANIQDTYRGQWLNTQKVPESKLFREIRMLSVMYSEALKNKELAAFSLANMTPFIQAIDRPIIPLKRMKEPLWMRLAKAVFYGLAIAVAGLVLMKIYRDVMAENDNKNE
jgi:hypothetical protein